MKIRYAFISSVTTSVCVCWAFCQHTCTREHCSRAGQVRESGTWWVTEGLMLAFCEALLSVKGSSDPTRTIQARNCPLDFPARQSWTTVSNAWRRQERNGGSEGEGKMERVVSWHSWKDALRFCAGEAGLSRRGSTGTSWIDVCVLEQKQRAGHRVKKHRLCSLCKNASVLAA